MKNNLDISSILRPLKHTASLAYAYRSFIFFLLVTALYGFIVWRINVLSTAPPTTADISTAQQNVSSPKISESTVQKLQGLQDNSVRVQSLFNEARQNPFQE